MHFDTQTLIALGVAAHLLGALAKALVKSPQRQAQIDAIEQKIDGVEKILLDQLPSGAKGGSS